MFGDQLAPYSHDNHGRERTRATSYLVEVLLDENNQVRRTRIHHVQSGLEDTWVNWDETRFLDYFKQRPELRHIKLPQADKIAQPDQIKVAKPAEIKANTVAAASPPSPATDSPRAGAIRINRLEIIPEQFVGPRRSFGAKQGFNVRLHLDLAGVGVHRQVPLDYTVALLARRVGDKRQQEFLKERGTITSKNNTILNLRWPALPRGIYRISAALTISAKDANAAPQDEMTASIDGGIFHVRS